MSSSATPTPSTTFNAADYTTGPDFQGWYLQTTPEPILCGSTETYFTSSTYVDCYDPSTPAPIPTACEGNALLQGGTTGYCATGYSCSSYMILPTEGAPDSEAVVRYGCLVNWGADTIYRTLPAQYLTPTSTPTITSSPSTASPTTGTTTEPTTTTTNTSSTPQPTTGTSSSSSNSSHGLSGGAIAGIVIGCVAAIAILALLIFRKRLMALFKKDKSVSDNEPTLSPGNVPTLSTGYAPSQTQSMSQSNSTWHPSELSSGEQHVHEIGSSRAGEPLAVHELG